MIFSFKYLFDNSQLTPKKLNKHIIIDIMDTHIKKPSTNSVGNWVPKEDEIILRYVYEKDKKNDNMMWGNL